MATFAVINDRGRRFRVTSGIEVWVDLMTGANPGDKVTFDKVELVSSDAGVRVGSPAIAGVKVLGEVRGLENGKKVIVYKYKRRKSNRRRWGARDRRTRVAIQEIHGA
ncbi:MAG: 50S ribosomal protein L21 [Planctomycetota bacterium]